MTLLSKVNKTTDTSNKIFRDAIAAALVAALLLLIPLAAKQFTDEMKWTLFDFLAAWILLFGAGFTYKLLIKKMDTFVYRAAAGIAVVTVLLLAWINLAVGVIGSEDNPANQLYFGVFAIGVIGALIVRLQPQGMAYTLFGMAIYQALVPVISLIIWKSGITSGEELGVLGIFILNFFFVILFVVSGFLFRYAARKETLPAK